MRYKCLAASAVAVAAAALTACGGASSTPTVSETSAIVRAVRAPYEAFEHRDAAALCAAFTPGVGRRLASRGSRGESCEKLLSAAFARTVALKSYSVGVSAVRVAGQKGDTASATLTYGGRDHAQRRIELAHMAGVWRVATEPVVRIVSECLLIGVPNDRCTHGRTVMLFSVGNPSLAAGYPKGSDEHGQVPVPRAVEQAGSSAVSEFQAGARVVGQSGCLACHRLGGQGNAGPGPDLSHVGSLMSASAIRRAILDPTAPMPSFRYMPRKKLRSLVDFLAELK